MLRPLRALLLCTFVSVSECFEVRYFELSSVFSKRKKRCTPMAGEATRLCSQAAASCRRSHNRRRNTAVEAAGAGYVGMNFTIVTMQNVFSVNWSFVALDVVVF